MKHQSAMDMIQDQQSVIDEILFWKIYQSSITFLLYSE